MARLQSMRGGRVEVSDPWGHWHGGSGERVFEVTVLDGRFYLDVLLGGSLGAGGAYVEGRWQCADLPGLLRLFTQNVEVTDGLDGRHARLLGGINYLRHRLRTNSRDGARRNIHAHYDLGNDFFELFLDPTMTYSSALFETPETPLEQASVAKLDRICRKLALRPEHHLVEIGTGWGSFAIHAAREYGCSITTTTISREQFQYASRRVREAGLEGQVRVLLEDYRDLRGTFDRLVSIEMIEAVGHEFLPVYFRQCASLLKEGGTMLVQAITMPDERYEQYLKTSDFIREYVFPGSSCPAMSAIRAAIAAGTDLRIDDDEDLGLHYAMTLRSWRKNFLDHTDDILALGYPRRLIRLWHYYFCYCEAGFAERYISVRQLLMRRSGEPVNALT